MSREGKKEKVRQRERERGRRESGTVNCFPEKKVAKVCVFELNVTSCKSQLLCLGKPITGGIISAQSLLQPRSRSRRNVFAEEEAFKKRGKFQV